MKKILYSISLLFLSVLLTGCACQHEWTQPDCLNPAVCTQCQEVGAEALGHDWADATCQSPQTCLRCSETQGEALGHDWEKATCTTSQTCRSCMQTQGEPAPHDFQDWSFDLNNETMHHVCRDCGFEESSPLDRAVYLESLLLGYWDVCLISQDDELSLIQDLVYLDLSLHFDVDGSVTLTTPENGTVNGTWTFDSFVQGEESSKYLFLLNCGERSYIMWLQTFSDSDSIMPEKMLVMYATKQQIYLAQYEEAAELLASRWKVAMDKWGSADGNMANWLHFQKDRTVTGHLNGPVEGRWLLVPIVGMNATIADPSTFGVVIFPTDEEAKPFQCTLYPEGDVTLKMDLNDYHHTFEPATTHDIDAAKAASQIPLGTWTSTVVKYLGEVVEYTTDFSITFLDDGTFTAALGRAYTGTWRVEEIDKSGFYRYWLYYDGSRNEVYCTIDSRNEEPENAQLITYDPRTDENMEFAKLNEDEVSQVLQGPTLPIGEWSSYNLLRIENGTEARESIRTREYSVTFHEDGTFTAMLDEEICGTWKYETMHHDSSTSFEYRLYVDDTYLTQMFIHDDGSLNFGIGGYDAEYRLTYYFKPLNEEMAEAYEQGSAFPVGTWTSYYYTILNADGSWVEDIFTSDYSATFHEDGTFTALLDQERTGTWEYIDVNEFAEYIDGEQHTYYSWEYHITFQGESRHQQQYIRCEPGHQLLQITVPYPENPTQKIIYVLTKD